MTTAAVIGLGVGAEHARMLTRTEGVALRWLVDHNRARAEMLARELGAGQAETSWQRVVEDPSVDLVCIASFDDEHFDQTLAALRAGKHVFCEKPLCRSQTEVAALKRAQSDSGRLLSSNLVLRAAPLFRWLRDQVRAGELGEIYSVDADYLFGRVEKITQGWRKNVVDYSVMQGGGVHMIDLLMWITGARPSTVSAVGNRITTRDSEFRYLDYVAANFQFPSSMVARVSANFGCVQHHQHVLKVYGTRATFVYDDAGARLFSAYDAARTPPKMIDLAAKPESKGALLPDFVAAIINGKPIDMQQDLDTITACVAADRSLALGQPVSIEYA